VAVHSARRNVRLDEFVIMPNHIHAIVFIDDHEDKGRMQYAPAETRDGRSDQSAFGNPGRKFCSPSETLGAVVRGFKAAVTSKALDLGICPGKRVWQRNFYEHVIRSEKELNAIRQYVIDNPANWAEDSENPLAWGL